MGILSYTRSLVAGSRENISDVSTMLNEAKDAVNNVTTDQITDGTIVNADINSSAAIAGSKIDTADGRLVQTSGLCSHAAFAGALGTSYEDIDATTETVTPDVSATVLVVATFACVSLTGSGSLYGTLVVDGTPVGTAVRFEAASGTRATATQVCRTSLTAAAHTLKLQIKRTGGTTTSFALDGAEFVYTLVAA